MDTSDGARCAQGNKSYDGTYEPKEVVLQRLALDPRKLVLAQLIIALIVQKLEVRQAWI
jgi:hypothetical protein